MYLQPSIMHDWRKLRIRTSEWMGLALRGKGGEGGQVQRMFGNYRLFEVIQLDTHPLKSLLHIVQPFLGLHEKAVVAGARFKYFK